MNAERRLELALDLLGYQGGTVHDVCKTLGLQVHDFLYADLPNGFEHSQDFHQGWFAARTCSREYLITNLVPSRSGNLIFWFGALSGQNLKALTAEEECTTRPADSG